MILDLSQYVQEYLEIKLPEGITIKLNKPSERVKYILQACIDNQLSLQAKQEKEITIEEQNKHLDLLRDFIYQVLNNNREGRKFTYEYVDGYFGHIEMIMALVVEYKKFVDKVLSHPN